MSNIQKKHDYINAVWQLCQANSGTGANHLHTYPVWASALEVEGHNVAGWIALPRYGECSNLNGIVFVNQARNTAVILGTSNNQGDHIKIGAKNSAQNEVIYVGACAKQATVISEITNCAVIVVAETETAHMVRKLAEDGLCPKNIIIFSNSKNLNHAQLIAEQRGCGWIQFASLENQEETKKIELDTYSFIREKTERLLQSPQFYEEKKPPLSFTQHTIKDREKYRWIVQDLIAAKSLIAIYGNSGAGKTFVALDLAAAISRGRKWLGKKTKKSPVLYLSFESQEGFVLRMAAHKTMNGPSSLKGVHVWFHRFSFSNQSDVDKLIAHINGGGFSGGVIFIDTLVRAMSGLDENSVTDMSKMIEACAAITEKTNCAIVLVGHSGKNQQAGLRGHSALIGALDTAIEVVKTNGTRKLIFSKVKEGCDGMEFEFILNVVQLGTNDDGEKISSCCVEFTETD